MDASPYNKRAFELRATSTSWMLLSLLDMLTPAAAWFR